jgi:hypothetical protein
VAAPATPHPAVREVGAQGIAACRAVGVNIAQRSTDTPLQGRVSAALTLVLFGPQAPTQALGALLIANTSYQVIYIASGAFSLLIALWLRR